jgi:hypothetical protein
MKEPRLWLLYLMARRRRILKQATERVRARLMEKKELRMINGTNGHANGPQFNGVVERDVPVRPAIAMVNEESQTSEALIDTIRIQTKMVNEQNQTSEALIDPARIKTSMVSEQNQTSEALLNTTRIKSSHQNIAERIRSSFGSSHGDSHSRSRPPTGHCPVFDKPFDATREDIKRQVERLMPKATPYIVIGWFRRSASDPMERILEFENERELFRALRIGERRVRGWREFFSLKSLKGFGLYKVRPSLITCMRSWLTVP